MWKVFADNLLPMFLAASAGWVLRATLRVDPRPIAHLGFYVFAPCLVFHLIVHSSLDGAAALRMAGTSVVAQGLPALVAWFVARRMGLSRTMTSAVVLVVLLPNAGNFGLSANLFAFGEEGLAHATVFFVTSALLTFSIGIFVASLGRMGLVGALRGLLRVPPVWALLAGLAIRLLEWSLPFPVERTVKLLADAAIPTFLVLLGIQLQGSGLRGPFRPVALAVGLRLVGGAAAGWAAATLFGLDGAARQAGILQASMPGAVIAIVLATEYDIEPAMVTSAVFAGTLLSPLTLTPLLLWLGA